MYYLLTLACNRVRYFLMMWPNWHLFFFYLDGVAKLERNHPRSLPRCPLLGSRMPFFDTVDLRRR